MELATGQILIRDNFVNGLYANRTFVELVPGPVPRLVRKSTAKEWLTWAHRFELRCLTYKPGETGVTESGEWNTWRGWGCEPKKGDVKPWKDLLDYLFKGDKENRTWFERWCAYPLRHPGEKLYTSVLMWGEGQGTGKSLVGYTLGEIYGENASVIGQEHLHGSFNSWAVGKQFVMGEEISGNDKLETTDRLKAMITQKKVVVNEKFKPQYVIPDTLNYYFTSNHPAAFFLRNEERRNFIWEAPEVPLPGAFYKAYNTWLKAEGPAALFHYLTKLDLGDFSPTAPAPVTSAKIEMVERNKSDLALMIDDLLANPDEFLEKWGITADVLQPTQLLHLLSGELTTARVSLKGLGHLLRKRQRTISKPVSKRFYVIRNQPRWWHCSAKDLYEHWAAHFDPAWLAPSRKKSK